MSFSHLGLRNSSLAALTELDISIPTPIQEQAIPLLLAGSDLVAQAQTGSGKTLAFGLPLAERCDSKDRDVQALVLTPTRELAQQVAGVLAVAGAHSGLKVAIVHGGVSYGPQIEALKSGPQIVVGTPGRVLDHLKSRALRLNAVRVVVLDEADQMLDSGFAPDVERILATTPSSRQTGLYSATTPDWVKTVSAKYLRQPKFIKISTSEQADPEIEHSIIEVWNGDKMSVLSRLLTEPSEGATIIFGRTRHGVRNLALRLRRMGYSVEALQGDLGQATRDNITARFRDGRLPLLVATNVAARGLDMLNISRVINYDLPDTFELFVHRVGRTARMGRSGEAITLIAATDLQKMQEIERGLGRRLPRRSLSTARDPIAAMSQESRAVAAPRLNATALEAPPAAPRRRRRRRPAGPSAVASPVSVPA